MKRNIKLPWQILCPLWQTKYCTPYGHLFMTKLTLSALARARERTLNVLDSKHSGSSLLCSMHPETVEQTWALEGLMLREWHCKKRHHMPFPNLVSHVHWDTAKETRGTPESLWRNSGKHCRRTTLGIHETQSNIIFLPIGKEKARQGQRETVWKWPFWWSTTMKLH